MEGWDLFTLVYVSFALAAGGLTKGIVGIGLPLTSISIMSLLIDAPIAVALMPIPILLTNLWQAFHGGHIIRNAMRFWPMILFLPVGVILGVKLLSMGDKKLLSGILGSCIVVFALLTQFRPNWGLSPRFEFFLRPVVGLLSGFIGGVSTFFGPPAAMFLITLRISKDEFVGALGLCFFVGIISMIISLAVFRVLGPSDFLLSAAATVPAFVGLMLGQHLRARIPEPGFRRILIFVFLLSGLNLIRQALV